MDQSQGRGIKLDARSEKYVTLLEIDNQKSGVLQTMFDSIECMNQLIQAAHPSGGWGYAPNQLGHPEPTSMVLLALSQQKALSPQSTKVLEEVKKQGIDFLLQQLQKDGSYRIERARPQAFWPTAISLFARTVLGDSLQSLKPSIDFLLQTRGRKVEKDPEIDEIMDIDILRVGWPWAMSNFSWVEPTSWAVLALRATGNGSHPRTLEGIQLLLDRAFDEGGINYGSRKILGRMTDPIPIPTALMLLALQGYSHPRIQSALHFLIENAKKSTDLEHLGWLKQVLQAYRDTHPLEEVIQQVDEQLLAVYLDQTKEGRPIPNIRRAFVLMSFASNTQGAFRLSEEARLPIPWDSFPERLPAESTTTEDSKSIFDKVKSIGRGMIVRGLEVMRQLPVCPNVSIARVDEYDQTLLPALQEQFNHFRAHVPLAGKRVVLKPNLVEWNPTKVINTNPLFVEAVIELCKMEGAAEIIVAEGPGHWRNVEFLVQESGLGAVLKKHNIRFVDINHDEPVKLLNLGRFTGLEYLYIAQTVVRAEVVISLPKLKTHHWAGATLSLKNLFGIMSGICYGWPKNELHWRGIPFSIVDIALTQTPHLAIVDGIVGMDGDGPLNGNARKANCVIMGADLPAVDATCCRLMGIDPLRVPYLALAAEKRLGRINENEINQVGLPIASLAQSFEMPPTIEKALLPKPAKAI